MADLNKPSLELANKILTEVDFTDRIKGSRLREHAGPLSTTMYSFEEVHNFLDDEFPAIDFTRLEQWFRDTFGDVELADKVAAVLAESSNNQERTIKTRDLMGQRLAQCKEVVEANDSLA